MKRREIRGHALDIENLAPDCTTAKMRPFHPGYAPRARHFIAS